MGLLGLVRFMGIIGLILRLNGLMRVRGLMGLIEFMRLI